MAYARENAHRPKKSSSFLVSAIVPRLCHRDPSWLRCRYLTFPHSTRVHRHTECEYYREMRVKFPTTTTTTMKPGGGGRTLIFFGLGDRGGLPLLYKATRPRRDVDSKMPQWSTHHTLYVDTFSKWDPLHGIPPQHTDGPTFLHSSLCIYVPHRAKAAWTLGLTYFLSVFKNRNRTNTGGNTTGIEPRN